MPKADLQQLVTRQRTKALNSPTDFLSPPIELRTEMKALESF